MNRLAQHAALALVFGLFIAVRCYHLERAPAHNETTDEYAWTWSGMSFLQTGTPRAWSNLKAYLPRRQPQHWRDHDYNMVEPWLDHPPLYSLYAGGWVLAQGARDIFNVELRQMRTGSLPLAALSFIGLFAFLRRHLSPAAVLLSLLFYAVLPSAVLQQRLVISENLYLPLMFGVLLLLEAQAARFASYRVPLIVLASALLPLTKIAALSCSVFLVLWALASDARSARWLNAAAVALGTCAGILGYLWWGRHFDAELFETILHNHHDRFRGFTGMYVLLFEPQLINKNAKDVLAVLGCVLALAGLSRPRASPWGLAVLSYAACMAFFVDEHRVFGWYFLPLYPWLCAGLGWGIVQASRRRQVGLSLLWCCVALATIGQVVNSKGLLNTELARAAYLLGVLLLAGGWYAWPRWARASIPAINGALVLGTALACLYEVSLR